MNRLFLFFVVTLTFPLFCAAGVNEDTLALYSKCKGGRDNLDGYCKCIAVRTAEVATPEQLKHFSEHPTEIRKILNEDEISISIPFEQAGVINDHTNLFCVGMPTSAEQYWRNYKLKPKSALEEGIEEQGRQLNALLIQAMSQNDRACYTTTILGGSCKDMCKNENTCPGGPKYALLRGLALACKQDPSKKACPQAATALQIEDWRTLSQLINSVPRQLIEDISKGKRRKYTPQEVYQVIQASNYLISSCKSIGGDALDNAQAVLKVQHDKLFKNFEISQILLKFVEGNGTNWAKAQACDAKITLPFLFGMTEALDEKLTESVFFSTCLANRKSMAHCQCWYDVYTQTDKQAKSRAYPLNLMDPQRPASRARRNTLTQGQRFAAMSCPE